MNNKLAQLGHVDLPPGVKDYLGFTTGGPGRFISNLIRVLIVGAGLYAIFNFVIAGYAFMSAGGDPKKIADAWAKIWQTLIGLIFAGGAFIIGAIISQIIFGDTTSIFMVRVFGP